jgi:hypothetical protein
MPTSNSKPILKLAAPILASLDIVITFAECMDAA